MNPVYTVANLKQRYGERQVLDIPELVVREGEILTLVGPSGAGKSTLLRLLAFLETPTAGSVRLTINGDSGEAPQIPVTLQRQLAMVFQRPVLQSRSVRANVACGLHFRRESDIARRVDAELERVKLTHLADAHPRTLSGGEMQRVALARALVLQPRVLLLDEPTANLDPHNVGLIEHLVREQKERFGTTIILVTHNIFQAKRLADRVALIYENRLIEIAATPYFFDQPQDARTRGFISGQLVY
jgi:tungstate transport system ATP-binding protein